MSFKRLTYADRKLIARRLTEKVSPYKIADEIGCTPATIYRDIRRGLLNIERSGKVQLVYDPDAAQSYIAKQTKNSARKPRDIIGKEH
jgi:IS30 family transposase